MKKVFIVYGTAIVMAFGYASYKGWTIADSVKSGNWGPAGQSVYHK